MTTHVFKKYANRKLYNPRTANYTSLKQIKELVLKGESVAVFDHATKQDITKETLVRIKIQDLEAKIESFSLDSLVASIKEGGTL